MKEEHSSQPASGEPAIPGQESPPDTAQAPQPAEHSQAQPPPATPPQGEGYTLPPLPPGYAVEPATGRIFFIGQVAGVAAPPWGYGPAPQGPPAAPPGGQEAARHQYGQLVNTMQRFIEGEASVADVVSTVYSASAQDDQLWKGILVGAAATVLLTSEPVRQAIGKTFGRAAPAGPPQPEPDPETGPGTMQKKARRKSTPTKE